MKKAKIFLTALSVLAVVGGALAFKAAKKPFTYYTCSSRLICEIPFTVTTETTEGGTKLVQYAPLNQACPNGVCTTFITTTD